MAGPRLIVYIEDNPANFALVRKVLEVDGSYRIVGAATGEEGVAEVERSPPDLVLLDLDLPGITGLEVLKTLHEHEDPRVAKVPVVAISASVMKHERQKALDAGCVWFIEKPFDIVELRRVVADAVAGRLDDG